MTLNIMILIITISGAGTYPRRYTSAFVLGNFLTAILVRNELFGRLLYLFVNTYFAKVYFGLTFYFELNSQYDLKWPPLKFRLACTSVLQHLGGIHSGCATSGFLWLFFKVVVILKEHKKNLKSTLATGVLTFIIVGVTIVSAFPWVRNTHHKSVAFLTVLSKYWPISSSVFERHHRFMGWCVSIPPNCSLTALICYCTRLGIIFSELGWLAWSREN